MVTKTKRKTSRQQRERRSFWFPVLILCLLVLGGAFWAYKSGLFNKLSNDKKDEEIVADTKNINTAELGNNVENKSAESKETDYGSSFKNQAEAASKEQEVAKNEAGLKIAEV